MKTELLEYQHQGITFEAYIAYDDLVHEKRPMVLVFHDWSGRNEFACKKAENLAQLGYIGVALDLYGKGRLGQTNEEKSALMQPLMEDRGLLLERMLIGLNTVKLHKLVDSHRIGAVGFCFGGLCALDLARGGAQLAGVVSFHGLLMPPAGMPSKKMAGKILALTGHDDPMVPPEQVLAFETEMTKAQVDWQVHVYGGTMHAFMNPQAHDPAFGTVYSEHVAKRAWSLMQTFFDECLF